MPDRNRNRIAGRRRPTPDRGPHIPPDAEDTPSDGSPQVPSAPVEREAPGESTGVQPPVAPAVEEAEAAAADVTPATVDADDPLVMVPSERRGRRTAWLIRRSTLRKVAEAAEAAAPAKRARAVSVVLSGVLAVLIVVILAFAGILGLKAWKGQQAEDARGEAAAAGRKAAETALSYDYRSLDKSFAAARATMTPDFATKFDETAKVAGELATKTKATVRAEVREVGVRDGDADRVTLVIFVNQTTTSTITQGKPRVDLNRTRFTMVRNGDQWLVQEIAGL